MFSALQKTIITAVFSLFVCLSVYAQAPESMSYQAVIRNSGGDLVTDLQIAIRVSILQGSASGTQVYQETHTPTTNANGLVSLSIGDGSSKVGSFSAINWGNGPYFIKTETNPSSTAATYTITGTSQLMSVPYALYAKSSGSAPEYGYIYNEFLQIVLIGSDVVFSNNGLISGGISHAADSQYISLLTGGIYEVAFTVSAVEQNQFALYQNGSLVDGSNYGSGAGTQQNAGRVIITAAAGDVITLRNHASYSPIVLQTNAGGLGNNVNASIMIRRLN